MALLRWIHLRKLVPLEELIAGGESRIGPASLEPRRPRRPPGPAPGREPPAPRAARRRGARVRRPAPPETRRLAGAQPRPPSGRSARRRFKDALLAEIRKSKAVFYNTVVAQAQRIEVAGDRVTFTFSPTQRTLREHVEQNRAWLEAAGAAAGGPQDRGCRRAGGGRRAGAAPRRRRIRRRTAPPTPAPAMREAGRSTCASRRWPTPACRRCSRCSRRRSATWKRCEPR